jgi:hypothetical protein
MLKTRDRSLRQRLALALTCGFLALGPVLVASGVTTHTLSVHAPQQGPSPAPSTPLGDAAPVVMFGSLANMKDPSTLSKKFVTRASAAAPDYTSGVQNAGGSWESAAGASEASWEQGTQGAITRKAFGKGVVGKGGKYQANATTLGAARYPQGVANAGDAWARGVTPYMNALKGANIGPKGPRGSPQQQQRSAQVQTILNKLRLGQ